MFFNNKKREEEEDTIDKIFADGVHDGVDDINLDEMDLRRAGMHIIAREAAGRGEEIAEVAENPGDFLQSLYDETLPALGKIMLFVLALDMVKEDIAAKDAADSLCGMLTMACADIGAFLVTVEKTLDMVDGEHDIGDLLKDRGRDNTWSTDDDDKIQFWGRKE